MIILVWVLSSEVRNREALHWKNVDIVENGDPTAKWPRDPWNSALIPSWSPRHSRSRCGTHWKWPDPIHCWFHYSLSALLIVLLAVAVNGRVSRTAICRWPFIKGAWWCLPYRRAYVCVCSAVLIRVVSVVKCVIFLSEPAASTVTRSWLRYIRGL